jgi:hypothetical protein
MKNIDTLLSERSVRPSRPLNDSFTSAVVTELNIRPKLHRKWILLHWIRTRIGILSLGLLFVAGTAAAAVTTLKTVSPTLAPVQTPMPNVNQTITKQLSNGSRIVGYNLENCHYFSDPTYIDTRSTENVLYEVPQGSTLTNAQLEASLEGVCESDVNADNMGAITKMFEKEDVNLYQGFSTINMLVENITPTSITVRSDPAYNQGEIAWQDKLGLTYTQFFSGLKVYDENTPTAYNDIKVGDTVQILMGHTPGYTLTEGVAQETTPDQDVIYAIMQVPPLTADPTLFFFSGLQQVQSCSTNTTGYCAINGQSDPEN